MRLMNGKNLGVAPAILGSLLLAFAGACSDDGDQPGVGGGDTPGTDGGSVVTPGTDGSVTPEPDGSVTPTTPELPGVLSVGTTCDAIGLGPLCSVTQAGSDLSANCSGLLFSGTIDAAGAVSLTSDGADAVTCSGKLAYGQLTATCQKGATSCTIVSKKDVLPGISCLELPKSLDDFKIAPESGSLAPLELGSCKLIQDECVFQAECANNVVLTGTVTATGLSFSRELTTLVAGPLQGKAPAEGEPDTRTPQFAAGVPFAHTCDTTLTGTTVSGTCWAGGRGLITDSANAGYATQSRWPITGAASGLPATCGLIGASSSKLFALDSCAQLRDGSDTEPGIGQPVCAFRQNNCIWDVNCGNNPALHFAGRLEPGKKTFTWTLVTGTPCQGGIDADGKLSGSCQVPVPNTPACQLTEIPAVPGVAGQCNAVPTNGLLSRGCGGVSIDCSAQIQHGCNFLGLCTFGPHGDLVIAGEASLDNGVDRLEFNGTGDRQCYAEKLPEISTALPTNTTADQFQSEWRGDCPSPSAGGAGCRGAGVEGGTSGYFGLQLFFKK